MTIVIDGEGGIVEQVERQLYKLIDVIKVTDLTGEETMVRELALIKVRCNASNRSQVLELVDVFRAQMVDVSSESLIIQIVAEGDRLDALMEQLSPYEVSEMVRTGRIAMLRGEQIHCAARNGAGGRTALPRRIWPSAGEVATVCQRLTGS